MEYRGVSEKGIGRIYTVIVRWGGATRWGTHVSPAETATLANLSIRIPRAIFPIVSRLNRPLISYDNRQRRKQLIVSAKRVTCTSGLIMRGWRTDFIV